MYNLFCERKQNLTQQRFKCEGFRCSFHDKWIFSHPIGHDQAGIIGGHVAVNRDGVEGCVNASSESFIQKNGLDSRVTDDE